MFGNITQWGLPEKMRAEAPRAMTTTMRSLKAKVAEMATQNEREEASGFSDLFSKTSDFVNKTMNVAKETVDEMGENKEEKVKIKKFVFRVF